MSPLRRRDLRRVEEVDTLRGLRLRISVSAFLQCFKLAAFSVVYTRTRRCQWPCPVWASLRPLRAHVLFVDLALRLFTAKFFCCCGLPCSLQRGRRPGCVEETRKAVFEVSRDCAALHTSRLSELKFNTPPSVTSFSFARRSLCHLSSSAARCAFSWLCCKAASPVDRWINRPIQLTRPSSGSVDPF